MFVEVKNGKKRNFSCLFNIFKFLTLDGTSIIIPHVFQINPNIIYVGRDAKTYW